MPQENYRLIKLDWERTLEELTRSSLIIGDPNPVKGKICMHVKTKDDKVSFHLSTFGNLQISHPNAESLRRARSKLKDVMVAEKWIPTDVSDVTEGPRILSKLKNRRLNDLELEWLFPWYYWFLRSKKRHNPPDKRLLRKISTAETFEPPEHDIDLYRNGIIAHQNYIRLPRESPERWSRRYGYKYHRRQFTEDELIVESR